MGFLLGVPQLAFGFICVTIGTKTTKAVTVGLLNVIRNNICAYLGLDFFK